MISAKLIKDLEKKGFELEFPEYDSNENRIIDILKEKNERLYLAIPILLKEDFHYEYITRRLSPSERRQFNRILIITSKIFKKEGIDDTDIEQTLIRHKIKGTAGKSEIDYYSATFKQASKKESREKEETIKGQIDARSDLNINQASSIIFAPAKMRIMEKIFNHESLTNTELKYYYRSIRPIIRSVLNENLQKYIRIIESTKKYR